MIQTVELTDKEKQTVRLIMFSYTDKEIARELEISVKAVSNRINRIAWKMGITENRGIGKCTLKNRIREKMNLERIR